MSFTVFVEPVAQSFWANTIGAGNLFNRFRGGNHLTAQLVFELLGETSTCGGHCVLSFSSTPILRGPTVRKHRGSPLRMDNGPEFISKALREWANEVDLVFIPPGQPWRNGFIESFNGRLRDECLSVNQFYSLNHAKGIIGIWKEDYNTTRPHSSLGYLTPAVYAQQCTH